jgi:hypothetical protein
MQLMSSLVFLLVANVEITFPISWQAGIRLVGHKLRIIIIGPSDFNKMTQILDNYLFPI